MTEQTTGGGTVALRATNDLAVDADALALMHAAGPTDDLRGVSITPPYFTVVQATSAFMRRGHENYVEGAHAGDLIDTLSRRVRADAGFIPCHFEVRYTEFKPNLGPLVKMWGTSREGWDACAPVDRGPRITAEGNEITESDVFTGLVVDADGSSIPAIFSMASTGRRCARRMQALISSLELKTPSGEPFTPPMYARCYIIATAEKTAEEKRWFIPTCSPGPLTLALPHGRKLFEKAERLRSAVLEGRVEHAPPPEAAQTRDDGGESAARGPLPDDDVPF